MRRQLSPFLHGSNYSSPPCGEVRGDSVKVGPRAQNHLHRWARPTLPERGLRNRTCGAIVAVTLAAFFAAAPFVCADQTLLKTHCAKCHSGTEPKGDFDLSVLGDGPTNENVELWENSLDYVKAGEMPPAKKSRLSDSDRGRLVHFLKKNVQSYEQRADKSLRTPPRRLNNRELANSVADVLLIEDIGTHQPTANLLGDTLQDGFDTNGDALGFSEFHMEQYIDAFRKIVDATILSGVRPATQRYHVSSDDIFMAGRNQNSKRDATKRNPDSVDFFDVRSRAYFGNFRSAPASGRYRIRIKATAMDRGRYDAAETGIYDGDPIRLRVHLGDRVRAFDLPDDRVMEIKLEEWLAAGTRLELTYPTDGLRMRGNGNFKFQYAIAGEYIKQHDPDLYDKVAKGIAPKKPGGRVRSVTSWHHWPEYWQGPRPRLFSAAIEGPIYETWPPKRQTALLGENPKAENAAAILRPIAERAWRRDLRDGEFDSIVRLVQALAPKLGDVEALKEGIVAVLVSPSFLLINPENSDATNHFATKFSYLLKSTTPDERLRKAIRSGDLKTFDDVRAEVQRHFDHQESDEFLREFPHAWLQLDRINFMAPDPERFRLYDRKRLSDDMIDEALRFFRHAIDNNVPVPEFLSADYSFLNADLAKVYEVDNVAQDSKLRKYTFTDGRRGGLLGMGAFLTLTADSLGTSPIHRAVYVMENLMGIHPSPPPPDVKIEEPDVRQAKTIKEILAAHTSDRTCASCHQAIDPFGYAFENIGPMGEWRDAYTAQIAPQPSRAKLKEIAEQDRLLVAQGLPPVVKPWEHEPIPVDASASFLSGAEYRDISEFRKLMLAKANRDRFVRCFITKLLTYANGTEPDNYFEIEAIVSRSAENDYRIVDTIAAVVDSPLFREK